VLDQITPVVLTRDEEANIARTLGQLTWAAEVIVVDSLSTDRTVEIAKRFPNVRVLSREIDTIAGQSNHGIAAARTPWILLLDADYFVTPELIDELRALTPTRDAYVIAFTYAIGGKPLRASLYPPRIVLFHRDHVRVWQDGHTPRFTPDAEPGSLRGRIIHDDRKDFRRFLQRQRRYMHEEAEKLRSADPKTLNAAARVRKLIVVAPFAVVLHTLFVRGVILDGVAGLRYTLERFLAELMLSWELLRPSR
jgi:glycosyltransferase involved in cell wall biosynthesis